MTPTDPRHHGPTEGAELDPLDALASAHLDGLTSPDEEARIASDPELTERVAAMERVREALHEPLPVDDEARERRIAAALAVFDADRGAHVSDLASVAARRSSRSTWRALGIAAAVALLVVAVPLLAGLADGGSDADLAATSDESADEQLADGDAGGGSAAMSPLDGAESTTEDRRDLDDQAGAPDAEAGESAGDDSALDYSGPSPTAARLAHRPGLLGEVEGLSSRVLALVLGALRVLGQAGNP